MDLKGVPRPRLQNLFLVIIVAKVGCSFLSWWLNSPWALGFWIPLGLMAIYIAAGIARDQTDVSDERFGDSCYYLGFIFTISSIAVSLFDVPLLEEQGKLKEIAVRFGAAMVSTFAGFIVRAYVAGFKQDVDESVKNAEASLLAAIDAFRVRLDLATEHYEQLDSKMLEAARGAVARIQLTVEQTAKTSADAHLDALKKTLDGASAVVTAMSQQLTSATGHVISSVAETASAMVTSTKESTKAISDMLADLEARLQATRTAPELLEESLKEPLADLKQHLGRYSKSIVRLETAVDEGAEAIMRSVQKIDGALVPGARLQQELEQLHLGLGNLIGVCKEIKRLTEGGAQGSAKGAEKMVATVTAVQEFLLRDEHKEFLIAIKSHVADIAQRSTGISEIEARVVDRINSLSQETKALAEAAHRAAEAAQTAAKEERRGFHLFGR